MSDYKERTQNGQVFDKSDVDIFRLLAIASGLRLYAKTGMKPNRAYTPTAMLNAATQLTKKKYKRGEYVKAADDLTELANHLKALPQRTIPYV
jgi:hypothetical protein